MMLIDRREVITALDEAKIKTTSEEYDRIIDIIGSIPTFDVRKKGRWIDVYKERFKGLHPPVFTCSICKKGYYGNVIGMYYCPVCGAKMEGAEQ